MSPDVGWNITFCAGYIVPPCKDMEPDDAMDKIQGSPMNLAAQTLDYFQPLFDEVHETCQLEIVFNSPDGDQQNIIRDLIRDISFGDQATQYLSSRKLALQLALATDYRSPTGLFLVVCGQYNEECRVVLWKFPAEESLQANFSDKGLTIEIIKGAFSRKTDYFKAAMFQGNEAETTFWKGQVDDRQANTRVYEVSNLWVIQFLQALPELTNRRGTKILGRTIKKILAKLENPSEQFSVISAMTVLKNVHTTYPVTLKEIAETYLSSDVQEVFLREIKSPLLASTTFTVEIPTLDEELGIRTITLDNMFTVTGPADRFNDAILTSTDEGTVIQIHGEITDQRLKSSKTQG
jgi:hypothetical protein